LETEDHLLSIRRSLVTLTLISLFVVCYFARDLLLPVLLGFLVALTLSPVTRGMSRIGIPYGVSAVLLIALLALAIAVAVLFSSATIAAWMSDSRGLQAELSRELSTVMNQIEQVREASDAVAELAEGDAAEEQEVQEVVVQQPKLVDSAMSVLASIGTTLLVALVLAIFLLASGDMFYIKLVQSFSTMDGKKRALTIVYDVERRVSNYLLTITLINAGLGLCVGAVLWMLGLPFAYIWGLAAFLLNFLPYLGGLTGVALVTAYSVISFDNLTQAFFPPLAYLCLTFLEGQFITPLALGRRLSINTVAVFLTVVLWGWLWGIPGALVAVPFLVVFKVVCDNVPQMQVFGNLLGQEGPSIRTREKPNRSDVGELKADKPSGPSAPA
jgi:predicted PurR-regulated permease PerM